MFAFLTRMDQKIIFQEDLWRFRVSISLAWVIYSRLPLDFFTNLLNELFIG